MLNSLKQFIDEIRPKTVCSGVITAVIGPSLGSVSITGGPVIQNVHIPPTAAQGDRVTLYRDQGGVWHIVGTESKPSVPVSAQTVNDIVGLITYKPTLTVTVTSGVTHLAWSTWPDFVGAFELQSSNVSDAGHADATTLAIVNGSALSLLNLTADRWFRVRAVTRLFVKSAWSDWTSADPLAPVPTPSATDQILYSADGAVWSLASWADLTSNFGSGGSSNFDELKIGTDPYTYIGNSPARNIWGVESCYGNDYTILGVRHLADDRSDTVLLVGDNAEDDLFWLVFYDHEGTEYSMLEVGADHARFLVDTTIEGQLAVQDGLSLTGALSLTGDISMSNGALVDGIDLSAHAASDSAHHAPVTLTAAADSLLSLSTQAIDLDTQAANLVLAGPTGGAAATPTMRGLVFADIPSSSNPGASQAILATTSSGRVDLALARIEHLGIGYEPSTSVGIYNQSTTTATGEVYAMVNVINHNPSSDNDSMVIGTLSRVQTAPGNHYNNTCSFIGQRSEVRWCSTGYLTSASANYVCISNHGNIGAIYGLFMEDVAVGTYTAAWSLYINGPNAHSYHEGNLLIGTLVDGMTAGGSLKVQNDFIHVGSTFESGDATPKFGSYTLTIPATGTVALLGTANVFTAAQKIDVNSTAALIVEQSGTHPNVVVVDTTNGRVGINSSSFFDTLTILSVVKSGGEAYQDLISYRDSVNGGGLRIFHARGTESSPTSLNVGDIAGVIEWKGYGTSFGSMGQIRATVEGAQVGADGLPSSLDFCTIDSAGAVQLSVRMNSAGNMLIGTTADGLTAGGSLRVQKDFYMVGGWAGFGTAPVPGRRANYDLTTTDPAYHPMGSRYGVNITFTDNNSYSMYGLVANSYVTVSASKTHSGQMFGMALSNILTSTFAGTQGGAVYGLYAALTSQNGAAGTVSGTVSVISAAIGMAPTTTTAFTTIVGVDITAITAAVMSSATVTNVYGLRIGDISSGGTLNYAIYTGAGKVRFGDNVLIGTTTDGMTANGSLAIAQDLAHRGSKAGFFNAPPVTKPVVTGSRRGNAALASLLTALADLGLIINSSIA